MDRPYRACRPSITDTQGIAGIALGYDVFGPLARRNREKWPFHVDRSLLLARLALHPFSEAW